MAKLSDTCHQHDCSLSIPSSAAMADSAGRVTRTTDSSQAVGSDSGILNSHPKNMCHQVYAGRRVANVVGRVSALGEKEI